MNTLKSLFMTGLLILGGQSLSAHALWIETAPAGKAGKAHLVKIIYAEPSEMAYEKIADWWSDVSSFTLWLTGPDGEKQPLDVQQQADHFTAVFTPAGGGLYTLSITHNVKDLVENTRYQFNAAAYVKVGDIQAAEPAGTNGGELSLYVKDPDKLQVSETVNLRGVLKRQAAAETGLTVFAPSGWSRSIKTGKDGQADFIPEWPGRYLIEAGKGETVTGKPYEKIYRISTVSIDVH